MRSFAGSKGIRQCATGAALLAQRRRVATTTTQPNTNSKTSDSNTDDEVPPIPAGVEFRTSPSPLSSSYVPTSAAAAVEGAIDPYALARDDPEAMERIRKEFEKVLLGPMAVGGASAGSPSMPRKVGGTWLSKEEQQKAVEADRARRADSSAPPSAAAAAANSSAATALQAAYTVSLPSPHQQAPFMPPANMPHPSELQPSFARFEAKTAEEERRAMVEQLEQNDALRRAGRLFKVHEACRAREEERRLRAEGGGGGAEEEAKATTEKEAVASEEGDNAMDDIDMMMGASAIEGGATTASAAPTASVIAGVHEDHPDPFAPFWDAFKSKGAACADDGKAPEWFVTLCRDLFMRTTSPTAALTPPDILAQQQHQALLASGGDTAAPNAAPINDDSVITDADLDSMAYDSEVADPARLAAAGLLHDGEDGAVDPYLWLPFDLRAEADYIVGRYTFPTETTYTTETRLKLSTGGLGAEYVCFCDTYAFPDRRQLPTSVGTVPSRLWVRPDDATPVVYLQLGEHVPPALWLPIKPTAVAVRRVFAEFALASAAHRDAHHANFEERLQRAEIILRNNNMPMDDGAVLRMAAHEAKDVNFYVAPTREFPNYQEFFLGEYDDPRELISYIQASPLIFALAHMQQNVDPHEEGLSPTISGPGIGMGVYRTLYSKSSFLLKVHLATEVKLPPQDQEGFEDLWREVDGRVVPKSRIPIFVRVMWPDHQRMSGGGRVIERFNKTFGTEFAPQMPVDAAMALFYVMEWAKQMENFMGIRGMRRRLDRLLEAAQSPQPPMLYPGTSDLPNPQYSNDELIGMHIQYLAHLGDPEAPRAIEALWQAGTAPVRMGCAKAALELGDRELFHRIVSSEPAGRMQHYMTRLVVKRRTRDLTSSVPKLMEDQYEDSAPLWARGGHVRLDASTLEGSIDVNRLQKTQRLGA